MIKQGNRKLYTAEEKQNYLHLFEEQARETGIEPDFGKFAKEWDIPVHQFRLWRQVAESGLELRDSKPLPITPKRTAQVEGNGKEQEASRSTAPPHHTDQLTRTYWSQQMLRARMAGRDQATSLQEAFVKATGFHPNTIVRWTREYTETPKGKKFEQGLQPKPPKVKKMPGRPAHTRYKNPETGKAEFKIQPEYWNRLIEMVAALDKDLRGLIFRMDVQNQRLDELMALWK